MESKNDYDDDDVEDDDDDDGDDDDDDGDVYDAYVRYRNLMHLSNWRLVLLYYSSWLRLHYCLASRSLLVESERVIESKEELFGLVDI